MRGLQTISACRLGIGSRAAELRCGVQVNPGGSEERRFVTPQYALVYVWSGAGVYRDHRGREHALEAGMAFARFPSVEHSLRFTTETWRAYVAAPCQVFEILNLMGLARHDRPVLRVGRDRALVDRVHALAARLRDAPDAELVDVLAAIQAYLVDLHRRAAGRSAPAPGGPVGMACELLSRRLDEPLSMPEVAAAVGLGYGTFRKRFRQEVGVAPGEYRIRRRLERAVELLVQGELSIKAIAGRLGYSDVYAFSAQFARFMDCPPGAFRRRRAG